MGTILTVEKIIVFLQFYLATHLFKGRYFFGQLFLFENILSMQTRRLRYNWISEQN